MCKKIKDRIKILMISLLLVVLPVQTVPVSAEEPVAATESSSTKVHLNRKKLTLERGQYRMLKIIGSTAISWESSKPAVAKVGLRGLVKAKRPGTAVISCKAANGKTYKCTVTVRRPAATPTPTPVPPTPTPTPVPAPSEEEVYNALIAMKDQYPEGMRWTNDNKYTWDKENCNFTGEGCLAFAMIMSDAAFGKDAPVRSVKDLSKVRAGDILVYKNGCFIVIVLEVKENSVIVAEGNYYNSQIVSWGREISLDEIRYTFEEMYTRYPD